MKLSIETGQRIMNVFLDTSSLYKLYQEEDGAEELLKEIPVNQVKKIFVSPITRVEFHSATYKNIRTKKLSGELAFNLISLFEEDYRSFQIVSYSEELISIALNLLKKYRIEGLRAQDSLQLASALILKDVIDLAASNDKLLIDLLNKEGIKTN